MTTATQIALTATPLAAYFYVLGVFHSGSRPRLVTGPVDVGMMAFGLGGLIAFGPFGRSVLGRAVGVDIGPSAWLVWVSLITLWSLLLAGAATLRVAIYHVTPAEIDTAVREALAEIPGNFLPTIGGFEDTARGSGITVRSLPRLRAGSVEAYGRQPDVLMSQLRPRLAEALSRMPQRPSMVSHAMFGLACLAMLVPVTSYFMAHPRAKEAVQSFLESFRWW